MYITAYFTDSGTPKTGLTPNISIYRISDSAQIVATTSMSEIANGEYKYNFASMTASFDYTVWVDGGAVLSATDRYKHQIIICKYDRGVEQLF